MFEVGSLGATINADRSPFDRTLDSVFATGSRRMQRLGTMMTSALTVPLAAATGAAAKFSSDLEDSLAGAQAQADLTEQQISVIGDSAEETAVRTGESTDDIVEAYKFATSAGLELAEAQELVGAAAEGSAAGFGTQRELVRLTTTALQAYDHQLDSSREFMDLLVGSAQAMELEVSKLGPAVQRNVGVAKELGVSLEQLMGGIGSVSEIMGDAQRGGRMFQTMLSRILKPSAEGEAAISDLFGSLDDFHKTIQEDGLLNTMVMLRKRLEEAGSGFEDVFTGQRGLEAALNFTNREGERTNEILDATTDTAGSLKDAFDDTATVTRLLSRSWEALKTTLRPFGDTFLDALRPVLVDLIESAKEAAQVFSSWPEETRQAVLKVAGLIGAGGPIMAALGTLGLAFSAISWPAMLGVTAFAGAVGVIMNNWDSIVDYFTSGEGAQMWDTIKESGRSLYDSLSDLFTSVTRFLQTVWDNWGDEIIQGTKDAFKSVQTVFEASFDIISTILDGFTATFSGDWNTFFDNLERRTEKWKESTATDLLDVAQFLARIGDLITITPGEGMGIDEMLGTDVVDLDKLNSDLQETNDIASETPLIFKQGQSPIEGFWDTLSSGARESVGVLRTGVQQMKNDTQWLTDFLQMDFSGGMEVPEVDRSWRESIFDTKEEVDDLSESIGEMPRMGPKISDDEMQAATGSLENLEMRMRAYTNMQRKMDPDSEGFDILGESIRGANKEMELFTSKMNLSRGELLDYAGTAQMLFEDIKLGAEAAFGVVLDESTAAFAEALFKAKEYNMADLKLRKNNLKQQEQELRDSLANQEIAQQEFNLRLQSLYNEQAEIESQMAKAREGIFERSMGALVDAAASAVKQILAEFAQLAFIKGLSTLLGFGGVSSAGGFASELFGSIFGGGRASGGPVSAGTSYMVGEEGPELFTPSRSGSIIPNGMLSGDIMPMQGQSSMASPRAIGAEIGRQLDRRLQKLGPDEIFAMNAKGGAGY